MSSKGTGERRMNRIVLIASVMLLAGCASNPSVQVVKGTYFGVPHSTLTEAEQVRANARAAALAEVTPLPSPLVQRDLVVSIPSLEALKAYRDVVDPPAWNKVAQYGRDYGDRAVRAQMVLYADAIRKRGMYRNVEIVDGGSLSVFPATSAGKDVLYNSYSSSAYAAQLYFASTKTGAVQVQADAAAATLGKQVQGVMDQVASLALSK